jgi:8-hydroxy-5-deazaflavin:NADPH oxidoreductase
MYTKDSKIGIIGSGIVGQVLGNGFLQEGNAVMLGTRDIQKQEVKDWHSKNASGKVGSFAETAQFADIIVIAVSGAIATEAIALAGKENFANKIVIDATNPIAKDPPINGVLKYFTTMEESLMEQIQHFIPEAKVVKAFSCVGNAYMYKPHFEEGKPTMFICGNDDEAKKSVELILENFGWDVEDVGAAESARAIEPLCILWCLPGFLKNKWNHAFKLLKQ